MSSRSGSNPDPPPSPITPREGRLPFGHVCWAGPFARSGRQMSALPSKRTAGRGGAAWPTPTLCICHVRALVPRGVHKRASLAKSSQHAEHLRARQPMDGTWDVTKERFTHPQQIKTNALVIELAGACWQGCHRTQRSHADYTTLFQALLAPSRSDVTRQALSGFSQTTQVPEGFHLPHGQVWASTDPCPKNLGPCRH